MTADFLIVGLGNPGKEYEHTRHNTGFIVADALLAAWEQGNTTNLLSGKADPFALWACTFTKPPLRGRRCFIAKPLTFMNRSGVAVQRIAAYYRIPHEQILVVHDELDLPLGRMKIKTGGGNAGHNGLKSLEQCLGTPGFHRLRVGIGKPLVGDTASYVLRRFNAEELPLLENTLQAAIEGINRLLTEGMPAAQRFCNGFSPG